MKTISEQIIDHKTYVKNYFNFEPTKIIIGIGEYEQLKAECFEKCKLYDKDADKGKLEINKFLDLEIEIADWIRGFLFVTPENNVWFTLNEFRKIKQ